MNQTNYIEAVVTVDPETNQTIAMTPVVRPASKPPPIGTAAGLPVVVEGGSDNNDDDDESNFSFGDLPLYILVIRRPNLETRRLTANVLKIFRIFGF